MGVERLGQGADAPRMETARTEGAGAVTEGAPADAAAEVHDHAARLAERPRMFASSHIAESAMRAQLSRFLDDDAPGFGVGAGGPADATDRAELRRMEAASRDVRREAIDWDSPEASLDHLAQVDSSRATANDTVRCGPASITAGLVLLGPDETNGAIGRLRGRIGELETRLEAMPHSGTYDAQREALSHARELLDEAGGAYEWTVEDAQRFQEAVYLTARIDLEGTIRSTDDADTMDMDSLSTPAVLQYRDLLWGASRDAGGAYHVNQPHYSLDGEEYPVDVFLRGDGHFLLGEGHVGESDAEAGGTSVLYDPWPQGLDHSAFSATEDGEGEMLSYGRSSTGTEAFDADEVPRMDRMTADERRILADDNPAPI